MKTIVVQCPNADVFIIVELLEANYISYIVKDYEPLASSEKHTKEPVNSAQQPKPGSLKDKLSQIAGNLKDDIEVIADNPKAVRTYLKNLSRQLRALA